MKKKAASAEAKKQMEKRRREAEAEEEDEEDEEDDDEGEPRGRRSTRATSSSAAPSRARTGSHASKRFKRTPSEDDGQQQSEEDEASDVKLLDAFYYPGAKCRARMATNKKWTSCHWCKGRKQGCSTLATFPKIRTSKGKLLHAAASWQDNARATTMPKVKQPARSKSWSLNVQSWHHCHRGRSYVFAKGPEGEKGEEEEVRSPSSSPVPSVTQVDLIKTRTTALVDWLATQLAEIQAWDTALKEIDAVANAEDLEWDRRLANMDEELRASHARHGALKARLAESEQQRVQMSADIAKAQRLLTIHQPVSAGMSQFLEFGSTIGGPGGIPQSVLGGQAGPSH
ncbi:hypothetical protein HYDPIDRAFT_33502 [Hydnomerulius pinastri MD-312]|uniref:Unplaced genomic scaffold scaffold_63, whole genome shotgun sequence n=1 Tax=Hydnomerulius pinastri MD-312 TaxID=994086 RepID=A0A0C9W020_9AGAM|nr:hypothetical protein HYDPIDRAFT_33502 [Hydnomerulius pinastri MD-312]